MYISMYKRYTVFCAIVFYRASRGNRSANFDKIWHCMELNHGIVVVCLRKLDIRHPSNITLRYITWFSVALQISPADITKQRK